MKVEEPKRRYKKGQKRPASTDKLKTQKKEYFQTNSKKDNGVHYQRLYARCRAYYESLIQNSRRKANVISRHYGQKVFLDEFWTLLHERKIPNRRRRLAFFVCAIDLVKNSKCKPKTTYERGQKLHEFYGIAKGGEKFRVHIRKNKSGAWLMSCFPED